MKKIAAILALTLVASFVIVGCGQKKEEPAPAPSAATPESVAPVPESNPAPETEEEPEEPANTITADEIGDLLECATTLQVVDACGLDVDQSVEYTDENGYKYNLVVSEEFKSIGDIVELLFDTFTAEAAVKYFPALAEKQEEGIPAYLYLQDVDQPGLYMLQGGKGFTPYEAKGEIVIKDADESSFTATTTIDDFGMEKEMTVTGILEDGKWKLASLEYEK